MLTHSNATLPERLDRIVRRLVVTPDMHRVHHSILRHETDSNFGFNLPWWDRKPETSAPRRGGGTTGASPACAGLRNWWT
jgi:sterol desaturase/sphingolipid hydroxylase (fatty acid hydroxylase superfamily)